MNEKEYKLQVSLGTMDYIKAAKETKNPKVLARIVEDCDFPEAHLQVACNPYTSISTLTRLAIDPLTNEITLTACSCHPSVDSALLLKWSKRHHVGQNEFIQQLIHILQVEEGVPIEKRLQKNIKPTQGWTSTGSLPITTTGAYLQWVDLNKPYYADSNTSPYDDGYIKKLQELIKDASIKH